ncbi:hypothetical protein BS329_40250 [Amycolatopsis coloradensis]|uniref:MvdD-like pre-ATP grasp domain-containing protein n=1 Tax=Amycolatopsis coloradensis TaxID=76021 RepID=A0A1R0KDU0_9PSEU|nr:hypothetical protein [Amycolatopsis coloradensis]OLZ43169.1 hypothetical protein BS329_40250 [Amycolatopsis coloradensis]
MTVLIIADERDPSVDAMVLALRDRGATVFRVDTAWFPTRLSLSARLRGGRWTGVLRTDHHRVDLEQIRAVWYRSPRAYVFPAEMNSAEQEHAKIEAKYGLGGVLMSLPVLWVNHPARLADSAYKPHQLVLAARCGLRVADTLITNSPDTVVEFADDGPFITKMLGAVSIVEAGVREFAHTEPVDTTTPEDLRDVALTAHQYQRWIPKAYEARVFVVGDEITASEIHAHTDPARVDWRAGYGTNTYRLTELPADVTAGIKRLMGEMGLVYGALDFAIDTDGRFWFLEFTDHGSTCT